ncbi:hypothetical protein P22_3169 [Propionispora sp. 2/2-37]|uniref:alpha/beta hydrolase n=1 Tax=Propionispora sp. 2/2-37 TaxID=1677858 RepID=UPI0006C06BF2|nr:alpha/beta hydrolase [Propionispora sp. 2/2-37]CUH97043.1 hypothetical protein P22_3169 [Propionispora sp. 2/2-37]
MKTMEFKLTNINVKLEAYLLNNTGDLASIKSRPAVLICPGGAYRVCSEREAEPIAIAFLAEGYQAFVLTYSLNENAAFPNPLYDAEEALTLIRNHSEEWRINPDKIAAIGFSAGGHVAAALGTRGKIRPNALILGYPCVLSSISEILPAPVPSLVEVVDEQTPPTFIFHTFTDETVPVANAIQLANALNQVKVPFELHIFQKGCHGLSLAKDVTSAGHNQFINPHVAKWFDLCVSWLTNLFGGLDYAGKAISEYSVDAALELVWPNPLCRQIILEYIPGFDQAPQFEAALSVSLRQISEFAPGVFTKEQLNELDKRLKAVPLEM